MHGEMHGDPSGPGHEERDSRNETRILRELETMNRQLVHQHELWHQMSRSTLHTHEMLHEMS